MRSIRLADCETLVLSLPEAADRGASAAALCARLGLDWRFVDATRASPGWIGCGLSHIRALRAWDGARPLLILEDDVAAGPAFAPIITVPADADAVYLGVSRYGAVEPVDYVGFVDVLAMEAAAPGWLRLHNMLGAHAILHLTPRWRTAASEAMIEALIDRNWDPDRGLAAIQGAFNVYAPLAPAFHQAPELQPEGRGWMQHQATASLPPAPQVGDVVSIWVGDQQKPLRLVREGARLRWVWA